MSSRLRVFLLMFAIGLIGTPYLKAVYERWSEVAVDLPKTESVSPIDVRPKYDTEIPRGGSGPSGPDPEDYIAGLFRNVDLHGARIPSADFAGISVVNSDFSRANLEDANFSKASILYSSFVKTYLVGADFSNAHLRSSDLTGAALVGGKFVRANLSHSDFSNAVLTNADFTDANLCDARLEDAHGLAYKQLRVAVINEFTSLPAGLRSERSRLLERSKKRAMELRREMSDDEAEAYFNPCDSLD